MQHARSSLRCVGVHRLRCSERERVKSLSRVGLFVTLWTVAHQATLSMGFSRQEYWSGLPFRCPLLFLKQARHVSIVGTCCAFCQEYSSSEYTIVAASLPSCLCSNVISYKALSLHLKLPPPHLTLPFLFPCLIFTVKLFYAS